MSNSSEFEGGFEKQFALCREEHEHGIVFLNYVLMRGGHAQVPCIGPPEVQDWKDIPKTFLTAVRLESQVKEVASFSLE